MVPETPSMTPAISILERCRQHYLHEVYPSSPSDALMSELEGLALVFVEFLADIGVTWEDFQQHADALGGTGHPYAEERERLGHIFAHALDPEYLAASHALRDIIQWPIEQEQKQRLKNEMDREVEQSWLDDTP